MCGQCGTPSRHASSESSCSHSDRLTRHEAKSEGRHRAKLLTAKGTGKYKGRNHRLTDDQIAEARRLISTGVPKTTVARGLGIDRTTLYRMLATPLSPTTPGTVESDVVDL